MKKRIAIVGLASLFFTIGLSGTSFASDSKFRLGLQGTQFAGGLSGIVEIADPWALQGVFDFGADAVALRILNRFKQEQFWNAYGSGTVGLWQDNHSRWWGNDYPHDDNNGLGLGVGLGIEYDWRGIDSSLPPLGWNIEIGASIVPGFYLDLGLGLHWMF